MFFDELNNDEWALIAPLVADEPAVRLNRRGRPRAEPRIVTNAVLWILTTGEPWSKLPGRYPSGPTCRRRFEEWQLNGTLLEMVRLLSHSGRTFAYIPQPAPPVTAKPAAPAAPTPSVRDEGLRGVSWKSPESWQAPGVSSTLSQWRSADPIADITRQLSGLPQAAPARAPSVPAATIAGPAMEVDPIAQRYAPFDAGIARVTSAATAATASAMHMTNAANATNAIDRRSTPGAASFASAECAPAPDEQRTPLSMGLAPRGTQLADPRGYLICVVVEQVPGAMYRGSAEVMKDGKRVERSGLVGPRFEDARDAQQYALDWARQWIDRECVAQAAGPAQVVPSASPAATVAVAPVQTSPAYAQRPLARALPALRHAREPVSANSAGHASSNYGVPSHGPLDAPTAGQLNSQLNSPLSAPLNSFRGPLRRYPVEPAAVAGVTSDNADTTSTERFSPSYQELSSHAG
ncbi:transposase [Paraburkholderia sp. ZP32-5]|uniref:transposase n=1 Tax=Paraburkholderia sp. ZP32-5 TaxID=2883245 RepID=UPI001F25D33F|nr:transposase [Paraburkholderia sp. ZP32-5]